MNARSGTLAACVAKAQRFLEQYGISGEVLVADNGSTDESIELATGLNARVVAVPVRGYGAALAAGIAAAKGEYVIMGDSDESYDFSALAPFVAKLRGGYDLVIGNRCRGGISPGAVPPMHRYFGNALLTALGRLFFSCRSCGDFYCGLRGFFGYPGAILFMGGLIVSAILFRGPLTISSVEFDYHTLLYSASAILLGYQSLLLFAFAKLMAVETGLHPPQTKFWFL